MLYIFLFAIIAACTYTGYGLLHKDERYQEYVNGKGFKAFVISVGLATLLGALHYLVWVQTLLTSKKNASKENDKI